MPTTKNKTTKDGLSKFQRYRKTQHHRGMRLLRVWVPDTQRPSFAQEAERQARLLHNRPEEIDAIGFIESAFEWPAP